VEEPAIRRENASNRIDIFVAGRSVGPDEMKADLSADSRENQRAGACRSLAESVCRERFAQLEMSNV
jgi:hypothetical protein